MKILGVLLVIIGSLIFFPRSDWFNCMAMHYPMVAGVIGSMFAIIGAEIASAYGEH